MKVTPSKAASALRRVVIAWLVFPVAPILTLIAVFKLCFPIWYAVSYGNGNDVGQAVVAFLGGMVPILLVLAALILVLTTWLGRMLVRWRSWPWLGLAGRVALVLVRVLVAAVAMGYFATSAVFFMGEETALARYWQVSLAWALVGLCTVAFLVQQWRRVRALWGASAS